MIRRLSYEFYTARELKPSGWLKKQLEIQADGLSGNLDKVWPDVRDSNWIGGNRDGWERVPYWLDGFIPLAFLLDDEDRIARAKRYMDAIMDAQNEDGWLCPCPPEARRGYDLWAALLMCKVLTVWVDCSGDERAVGVLSRALKQLNSFLNGNTLHNWGASRWFEGVIPALWLYERTGEEWLLDLCNKLDAQGVDWERVVRSTLWETQTTGWDYLTHVVNVAMMLKCRALMSRITGEDPDAFALAALDKLMAEHGMATHHFTGDECLAGRSPVHGSELCSVVEAMYSYEQLFSVSGNLLWLDQLEREAFNALPATVSPDMWSHQYDQLTNQIACVTVPAETFRANGPESITFGLEPNYGCCTANFNQGFPKFALSTFMKHGDGIASCALAPAKLTTTVRGVPVEVELETGYPFRDVLTYRVKTARAVRFPLYVRIPSFAVSAAVDGASVDTNQMLAIDRRWEGETVVTVKLSFSPQFEAFDSGLYALWRGPLLYALPLGEEWTKKEYERAGVERTFPFCDYEIRPTTPWNYAFAASDPASAPFGESDFTAPFDPKNPPVWMEMNMVQVPWSEHNMICAPVPDARTPLSAPEPLRLIPYGCTNLRMTEMYII